MIPLGIGVAAVVLLFLKMPQYGWPTMALAALYALVEVENMLCNLCKILLQLKQIKEKERPPSKDYRDEIPVRF